MCASFQLVRRIYKGIPLQLRGEVWCLLLDIPKIKEEKKDFYEVWATELKLLVSFWCFIHLFPGSSSETEGQSQRTLPRRPTDRLGRESDLQGPHHVHEPLWRQVSVATVRMFCFLGGSSSASGRTLPEGNLEIFRQAASWSPCILVQMLVMAHDWAEDTSLLPVRKGQTTVSCSEKLLRQLTLFMRTSCDHL